MDGVLQYLVTGTRGGHDRARILRALDAGPMDPTQLAEHLDSDRESVRHHLDVLVENGVLERQHADDGVVYRQTDRTRRHREERGNVPKTVE